MRFNSERLAQLAAMPDEKLWAEIVKMGGSLGYSVPTATPSHADMERIRGAMTGGKINMVEAMQLLRSYGKGRNK